MTISNKPSGIEKRFVYGTVFRYLHWIVALLVVGIGAAILLLEYAESAELIKQIHGFHRGVGVAVLFLVVFRLAWRLLSRDKLHTGISPINQLLASASHAFLYVLLLATPLLGWLEISARGKSVFLFGVKLPGLLPKNLDLASDLQSWHLRLADAFLLMIALHLLAVAWHFLIKRDGVLYAMLPWNFFRPSWGRNKKPPAGGAG